jgi:hypothetical protein
MFLSPEELSWAVALASACALQQTSIQTQLCKSSCDDDHDDDDDADVHADHIDDSDTPAHDRTHARAHVGVRCLRCSNGIRHPRTQETKR